MSRLAYTSCQRLLSFATSPSLSLSKSTQHSATPPRVGALGYSRPLGPRCLPSLSLVRSSLALHRPPHNSSNTPVQQNNLTHSQSTRSNMRKHTTTAIHSPTPNQRPSPTTTTTSRKTHKHCSPSCHTQKQSTNLLTFSPVCVRVLLLHCDEELHLKASGCRLEPS